MKIMICGSMAFAKDMVKIKNQLAKMGHQANLPHGTEPHLKDKEFVDKLDDNYEYCIKNNIMKKCFDQVAESDAVLVLNLTRNGVDGYIGVSALMEMGVAHHLNKKIFLFNKIPDYKNQRWAHEVSIMQPKILDGDLTKIK
ncbi:MAG: hypothetical protein Q7K55_01915 [Candidatus Levybacteria bacterium]|nr:hypothetical protein [Candidatus Levybacteria bacterium]